MNPRRITRAGWQGECGESGSRISLPVHQPLPRGHLASLDRASRTAAWDQLQALALLGLAFVLVGLWVVPELTLRVVWSGLVPLLPATLLIHPGLWRNVCPLATLNMLTSARRGTRRLSPEMTVRTGRIGILLVFVLIPARRLLLNADARATFLLIAAVASAAAVLGSLYQGKAGYCNAVCPMLHIERLYGHAPLLEVSNPRCDGCSVCTARGCLDLAPAKSIAQILGPARRSWLWLRRPYGVFAAAFPGLALGYFLVPDSPSSAGYACLAIAVCAGVSYLVSALAVLALRIPYHAAMTALGAVAMTIFYWFTASNFSTTWGLGGSAVWPIRVVAAALVAVWVGRRIRGARIAAR